ncbi:MAG TPA: putative entry exclusion protein TrbK-alt [Rhizomicrobium sp.]|jgi:conjugative transfer region protein TrbK|nr:putative entry exclusion protein TrbK-alt [Rhizomicrobium sp.]
MRVPSITTIARAAGFTAVATVIAVTALQLRHESAEQTMRAGRGVVSPADPLALELARCRTIGIAAKDDRDCEAAWAENRRRFFAGAPDGVHPSASLATGATHVTPDAR